MQVLIFSLFIIISIIIVLLVTFQDDSDGLGGVFGGGSGSVFGAKSSSAALKITGAFIALFFGIVLLFSFFNRKQADDSILQKATQKESAAEIWDKTEGVSEEK